MTLNRKTQRIIDDISHEIEAFGPKNTWDYVMGWLDREPSLSLEKREEIANYIEEKYDGPDLDKSQKI